MKKTKKMTVKTDDKSLLILKKELILLEHELKMKRLEYERGNIRAFHDFAMERQRIKSAEIRKNVMRKRDGYRY